MDKDRYLKELEKRLQDLTEEQRQQEIFRVSNEFDNGKELNDLSLEVANIHEKYKNVEVKKHRLIDSLNNLKNKMKKNDWKTNSVIIRDIVIIVLIVSVLKIPFIGLETLLFSIFENKLTDQMYTIFNTIIEIIYIIFAIFLFIKMFKRRFKEEMS